MREATTLLGIIRNYGERTLPLTRVYPLLYQPSLYLAAYGRIARNQGALTKGATAETADGMTLAKIHALIDDLRHERYRWTPARRVYIPKTDGKRRPLGVPTWTDKLLQEVLRSILEAYYEPQFSPRSHGFRPNRGCHTALREVYRTWTGTTWFIEGDISHCFDRLDHQVLLAILRENIHDHRFLRLIERLLQAGYLEEWTFHATLSGTPQGGVVSPILANIYLDRLDRYVETALLPQHHHGKTRRINLAYNARVKVASRLRRAGEHRQAAALRREAQQMPSVDTHDPHYRRLRYVRYADDFLLGFAGPKDEAEAIKRQLGAFLRDTLKLELSDAKTLVTHGRTEAARFLGYELSVGHNDRRRNGAGHRNINGVIALKVPHRVIEDKLLPYLRAGQPVARPERLHDSAFSIVSQYQAEFRGIAEYYQLAHNLRSLAKLKWVLEQSLTKTLGAKLRLNVPKVYDRFGALVHTDRGPRKVLRVTVEREGKQPLLAQWGAIPLVRRADGNIPDQPPRVWSNARTELVQRLLADTCELCGSSVHVQVHHIRALKDLQRKGRATKPEWVKQMAARHRKTLIVCQACHVAIHTGRPTRTPGGKDTGKPDAGKACTSGSEGG